MKYENNGRTFVATMGDGGFGDQVVRYTGLRVGDHLTVYVDQEDPNRTATTGGLSSEGRRTYLPWLFWGLTIAVGQFPIRSMYRRLRGLSTGDHASGELVTQAVVHPNPAWADRADSSVLANIDAEQFRVEKLAARMVSRYQYEICCVPFFAKQLALGDLVEVGRGGYVVRNVKPSRREVFRLLLTQTNEDQLEAIKGRLSALGALFEWLPLGVLAIDCENTTVAERVAAYIAEQGLGDRAEPPFTECSDASSERIERCGEPTCGEDRLSKASRAIASPARVVTDEPVWPRFV
ncbi:DUF4265 domain-containing protein [Allorhizocola rhizosphaerae]|uniref:DUF4265 domain-containing protein n=1 Tax=Allorhizocola rhizosphaerae TaxID=1872709 RepID=UPI0013C2D297|nr:DUF4265 domain-containing protein [Allorhizocola rhizosphaerae]